MTGTSAAFVRRRGEACQAAATVPRYHAGTRESCMMSDMPTLIRLLVVLGLIAAAIYGGMIALVVLVEPSQREMTVRIPGERLQP
jgi:hypothetical protein